MGEAICQRTRGNGKYSIRDVEQCIDTMSTRLNDETKKSLLSVAHINAKTDDERKDQEMILNHVFSWSKSALGDDTAVKLLSDIRNDLNKLSAPCDISNVLKNFYEKIKPDEEAQS